MANNTFNSLVGDLRLSEMISQEIRVLLNDTSNLRNSPFLDFVGSINGMGSDTIRVRQAGYGQDLMASYTGAAEDTAIASTSLTDAHADVVVKRLALSYGLTDLASMTGMGGANEVDPFRIAAALAASYEASFADLTADVMDGFSTSVNAVSGGAPAVLTVEEFVSAIGVLEQASSGKGVDGPFVAMLHPKQFVELQDSIRAETGAVAFQAALGADIIAAKGRGFKGSFLGVDIYTSSYVNVAASARQGALWGPGALGYATGAPSIPGATTISAGEVMVELDRDASRALTNIVGHAYLGMSIIEDARGVVLTSAS